MIWRHDVLGTKPGQAGIYSKYFGGIDGSPFNDRICLNAPEAANISSVGIRSGTYIDAIQVYASQFSSLSSCWTCPSLQVTYNDTEFGETIAELATWHGGAGGTQHSFELRRGEYIVRIQGRYNGWIVQLCFVTNKGVSLASFPLLFVNMSNILH